MSEFSSSGINSKEMVKGNLQISESAQKDIRRPWDKFTDNPISTKFFNHFLPNRPNDPNWAIKKPGKWTETVLVAPNRGLSADDWDYLTPLTQVYHIALWTPIVCNRAACRLMRKWVALSRPLKLVWCALPHSRYEKLQKTGFLCYLHFRWNCSIGLNCNEILKSFPIC